MSRAALLALLVPVGLGLASEDRPSTDDPVEWELSEPAPVDDGRAQLLERYTELECTECHEDVAREWASTRHATAWVDELYQEEVGDVRRPKGCWGCHVPEPLLGQGLPQRPQFRPQEGSEERHFGVTCASCHLGSEGAIHGPWTEEELDSPHDVARSDPFLPAGGSALCIACHATNIGPVIGIAKDFETTAQAQKGRSCVGCHMAVIERPIATDPDGEKTYPVRRGRSHALQTPRDPAFLRRAFGLTLAADGDGVTVVISNLCGHRVPGVIERELVFTAELLDEDGRRAGRAVLTIDNRKFLPTDGTREIRVEGRGVRLKVSAVHDAAGFEDPVPFLDETLAVER